MNPTVKLPMGIDNFEKLHTEDFYYVDKTGLIKELLNDWSEVNLFTSPPQVREVPEHEHAQMFF